VAKLTPAALEERLIAFGSAVCLELRRMPKDLVGTHVRKQLVRSATSPAANYAEARGAESRRDFVHKLQVCLKELRETSVWLRFTLRLFRSSSGVGRLLHECNELIAIFVMSVNTATKAKPRRQDDTTKSPIADR
jgi:four helix bundle protein